MLTKGEHSFTMESRVVAVTISGAKPRKEKRSLMTDVMPSMGRHRSGDLNNPLTVVPLLFGAYQEEINNDRGPINYYRRNFNERNNNRQ